MAKNWTTRTFLSDDKVDTTFVATTPYSTFDGKDRHIQLEIGGHSNRVVFDLGGRSYNDKERHRELRESLKIIARLRRALDLCEEYLQP